MNHTKRQAKSSLIVTIVIACLALAAVIGVVAYRSMAGGSAAPLPVASFTDNPRSFAGNQYEFEARIDTQLGYEDGLGRIILCRELATDSPVPVFVSHEISNFSPNPGQIYRFSLRVDGNGMPNVETFRKL